MSLVLAIALWSHVRGEVNPLETATFSVKLDKKSTSGRVIANLRDVPAMVRVTIRAPRAQMRKFTGGVPSNPLASPNDAPVIAANLVRARLDFSNFKGQRNSAPIIAETEVEDAEILGVKPAELTIETSN